MNLDARINAFVQLGVEIAKRTQKEKWNTVIQKAAAAHPFFTEKSIQQALHILQKGLDEDCLRLWCQQYPSLLLPNQNAKMESKTVALIMAGNIPLVGFHDFIASALTGVNILVKLSSNDPYLLVFLTELLIEINPEFARKIQFTQSTVKNFDAIIATGSNNTSRYFDYYFGKYPHIIRRNRNSCAILTGHESSADLQNLSSDMLDYYGLGCRNVSKLYFPPAYSPLALLHELERYQVYSQHHAYRNNYDYQKSLLLINKTPHLDNGVVLLCENTAFASPISVYHYEYYQDLQTLRTQLTAQKEQIQCIVSDDPADISFGQTQNPQWMDYADGQDVMAFLLAL
ncbi:MAG: acyl-CoA reductase [Bacteroidales bacterium]